MGWQVDSLITPCADLQALGSTKGPQWKDVTMRHAAHPTFCPLTFEGEVSVSANKNQMKARDFSCQEWDRSWLQTDRAEPQRMESVIKARPLGSESARAVERGDKKEVEKIRAVRDIPAEAFDDTAGEGKTCLCWAWATSVMQRDALHSREQKEMQEVMVTLEVIWGKRPFKSVDTVNKLYGIQSQKETANYPVWPAVWQATHCRS